MPKRYELLKDLPNITAKTIGEWNGFHYVFTDKFGCLANIHKSVVEYAPEWFKEVKEKEKEWEILQSKYPKPNGDIHKYVSNGNYNCKQSRCEIFSVKRLSDGDIFRIDDDIECAGKFYKIKSFEEGTHNFLVHVGMSYPLSFGSIKKIKSAGMFQWTDELVHEFGIYNTNHPWISTNLEDFKASKQSSQASTKGEKITVDQFEFLADGHNGRGLYFFETKKQVHPDKFPLVLKAIEAILNCENSKP